MRLKNKNKIFKTIAIMQIFMLMTLFFAPISEAWGPSDMVDPITEGILNSVGDATSSASETLESRYHLDSGAMQGFGEYLNVGENKGNAPEVDLLFSPVSPKLGEKLTATALPKYFQNSKDSLYYTWFLKHKNCQKASGGDKKYDASCDLNDDDEVDVEDWKIEAARTLVNNGYRAEDKASYNYGNDADDDGFGPLERFVQSGVRDDDMCDDIGYSTSDNCAEADIDDICRDNDDVSLCTKVPFGGVNINRAPSGGFRCYVKDPEDGKIYEIVEESVSSSGRPIFRFNGSGGNYCPGGTCTVTISGCDNGESGSYSFPNPGEPPGTCPPTSAEPGGPGRYSEGSFLWKSRSEVGSSGQCKLVILLPASYGTGCTVTVLTLNSVLEEGEESGMLDDGGTQVVTTSACTHLFPHAPGYITGDGKFEDGEEEFWKTNPLDADTSGFGLGDEATIIGLGKNSISWLYNTGDEIGVAVEGIANTATKQDDSSQAVMWAFSGNIFSVEGSSSDCEIRNKGTYSETISGYSVEIDSAEVDLNACLEENIKDPLEGGQPGNIEVALSSFPESPSNDSSGSGNGDNVSVQAMIANANANNMSNLYYKWTILGQENFTLDTSDWTDISNELITGMSEGLNRNTIDFSLNLDEDNSAFDAIFGGNTYGYIRVILDVEESFDSGTTRSGTGEVVIKATTGRGDDLMIRNASYSGGLLSLGDRNLCETNAGSPDGQNTRICYVSNNEIAGVTMSDESLRNFSWSLNGEELECTSETSALCNDDVQTNTVFFPIVGNVGDTYTLNLIANDTNSTPRSDNPGFKINITQVFKIIEPVVKLRPLGGVDADDCTSDAGFNAKKLGEYIDINSENEEDVITECSTTVFKGSTDGVFDVEALFNPSFISNYIEDVVWTVNGEIVEEQGEGESVPTNIQTENLGIEVGGKYNVSFSGKYRQDESIKRALANEFKISQFDFAETTVFDAIQIEIVDGSDDLTSGKSIKIMGSLISNLPTQMLFLFRIMLTITTVIFISGMTFALGRQES